MKKVKAEVWFWLPDETNVSHWWTGLISRYIHVAPVVAGWNLTAHIDGSEWLSINDLNVDVEYRDADVKIPVLVPAHTLIGPKRYEDYTLPRVKMWWHHICRACYGIEIDDEPKGTCVWLTKRVLGWDRPDLQTPDELYKELICKNYQGSSESS